MLHAPAKINLRLKIEGRRPDGYHLLSMINVCCDLGDSLKLDFVSSPEVSVQVRGAQRVPVDPEKNLGSRAFLEYRRRFGIPGGVVIEIEKRIPSGGGLGGGSSDAACVLRALHQRFPVSKQELFDCALSLGADVPYCLQAGLCHVTGIGETLRPLTTDCVEGKPCALIFPAESIATEVVFSRVKELRSSFEDDLAGRNLGSTCSWSDLLGLVSNDLEVVIERDFPVTGELLWRLRRESGFISFMTGSGSTLVSLPIDQDPERVSSLVQRLLRQGFQAAQVSLSGRPFLLD